MNPLEIVKVVIEYFKGQPFSNVIAFLQLIILSVVGYYGVVVLVPGERAAISDMLNRTEEHHTKQVESITTTAGENVKQLVDTFEKTLDRYDRRAGGPDGGNRKATVLGRGDE